MRWMADGTLTEYLWKIIKFEIKGIRVEQKKSQIGRIQLYEVIKETRSGWRS